jgi:hypothetical protein
LRRGRAAPSEVRDVVGGGHDEYPRGGHRGGPKRLWASRVPDDHGDAKITGELYATGLRILLDRDEVDSPFVERPDDARADIAETHDDHVLGDWLGKPTGLESQPRLDDPVHHRRREGRYERDADEGEHHQDDPFHASGGGVGVRAGHLGDDGDKCRLAPTVAADRREYGRAADEQHEEGNEQKAQPGTDQDGQDAYLAPPSPCRNSLIMNYGS